ncbi:hypothetical protein CEP53_004551 [Fusarium sp. AF-6]|nr:hypothetical protein CEP53_004551 [Fusarium sp. AF-6]
MPIDFKTLAGDWSAIDEPIIRQELETGEHPARIPDWGVPNHLFPIRWHHILSEWKQSMTTLRSFQITGGELYARHEGGMGLSFAEAHRQEHEDFRHKLFPQPSGVKVKQDSGFYSYQPLRYLYFDDMEFWNEWKSWDKMRSEDEGSGVEDGVEARDKATLLDFLETIQ